MLKQRGFKPIFPVKLRSVSVTVGDLSNPFFVVMGQGAEQEAKKIGGENVKFTIVSSGYDLNQQTNQMENFVAANTDNYPQCC